MKGRPALKTYSPRFGENGDNEEEVTLANDPEEGEGDLLAQLSDRSFDVSQMVKKVTSNDGSFNTEDGLDHFFSMADAIKLATEGETVGVNHLVQLVDNVFPRHESPTLDKLVKSVLYTPTANPDGEKSVKLEIQFGHTSPPSCYPYA